jgi:hypothetical protein
MASPKVSRPTASEVLPVVRCLSTASQVILHPIPRNREEFGLQAGPFLLATRERAHIVATVPMTIEKLNLSGTPTVSFFTVFCMAFRGA